MKMINLSFGISIKGCNFSTLFRVWHMREHLREQEKKEEEGNQPG
jgi:hypothetical protein